MECYDVAAMSQRRGGGTSDAQGALPLGAPAPVVPRPEPGDRDRPLTVEALVRIASLLLEEKIGTVWIEGEISNLRAPGSGHLYFVLKDDRAQIPAVMWRSTVARLRFRLEEGKRFLFRGKPGVYPEQGKLQLYVDAAEPTGLGAAALALEQLKQRLAAEGLFDPARKRPLPPLPRRIGVVTSPTGAAVRDIIRVVERRFPTPIVISPTRVQGDGAGAEIAAAIARIGRVPGIDVVIVGRGGGSAEDLSAFNDEAVVRAIAACPAPVVSAVGHEVDITLADLVADVRAATPTAAGELAVPERAVLGEQLAKLEARLAREARLALGDLRVRLERLAGRMPDPTRRIDRERQRLDEAATRAAELARAGLARRRRALGELEARIAALHPEARIHADRRRIDELAARARAAVARGLTGRRRAFETAAGRIDAMSPLKVLDRGYAIALAEGGRVVTRAATVAPGDALSVRVARGTIDARVERIQDHDGGSDDEP